jgi:hypothetical protein
MIELVLSFSIATFGVVLAIGLLIAFRTGQTWETRVLLSHIEAMRVQNSNEHASFDRMLRYFNNAATAHRMSEDDRNVAAAVDVPAYPVFPTPEGEGGPPVGEPREPS